MEYTVKELITKFKALAEEHGPDFQFNTNFANGEMEYGEDRDFIEKYNFYRSFHSNYLVDAYFSYGKKRFKAIREDKDKLIIIQIEG